MHACLFGTYNRGHSANRILANAIGDAGFELTEVHEPLWETTRDKGGSYFGMLSLLRLAGAWLVAAIRLRRKLRDAPRPRVVCVGFNGQLDILLLRLLLGRHRPRVVFAPLVTITETLVVDRRRYGRFSPAGRLMALIDRLSLRAADAVVVDSEAHRRWISRELGVELSRLVVCHLGVDNEAFAEAVEVDERERETVEVLWFGQYLPLHGLDVIVDAIARLAPRKDLRFVLIGTGELRPDVERQLRAARADVECVAWVDYAQLSARIARADIVLGIFGRSDKARMVIPNKVYEAARVGRAVITGDTEALREVFEPGRDLLACETDGAALAAAIALAAADPQLRRRLGASAARLMESRFSPQGLGRAWRLPLIGPDAASRPAALGVAILHYSDAASTLRCLDSVLAQAQAQAAVRVLIVDNASPAAESRALAHGLASRERGREVELLRLDVNRGYAGGNNRALDRLFTAGCEQVLLLNDDLELESGALDALVTTASLRPGCGPVGPVVMSDAGRRRPRSVGERMWPTLAWLPRTLLRHRRLHWSAYPVRGLLGCAMLIPKDLWMELGGLDEGYFAYYEETEYCLRAWRSGRRPLVEPGARVVHRGHRGFGAGLSPLAAYLKSRNFLRFGRRNVSGVGRPLFLAGAASMFVASMALYAMRGQRRVVRALQAGFRAGVRGEEGVPPHWLFVASGYVVERPRGREDAS